MVNLLSGLVFKNVQKEFQKSFLSSSCYSTISSTICFVLTLSEDTDVREPRKSTWVPFFVFNRFPKVLTMKNRKIQQYKDCYSLQAVKLKEKWIFGTLNLKILPALMKFLFFLFCLDTKIPNLLRTSTFMDLSILL